MGRRCWFFGVVGAGLLKDCCWQGGFTKMSIVGAEFLRVSSYLTWKYEYIAGLIFVLNIKSKVSDNNFVNHTHLRSSKIDDRMI
jgi:hypothetical protein